MENFLSKIAKTWSKGKMEQSIFNLKTKKEKKMIQKKMKKRKQKSMPYISKTLINGAYLFFL